MESDLISLAKLIWQKLSKKRRSQLCFLLCIMVMSAAAEMLSLATLMPFIEVLINPERIWNIKVVRDAALMVRINSADNLAGPVTLIFIIASLTLAGLKIANLWLNSKLSAEVGRDFSYEVYRRIIYQPYEIYVRRRSSETITILQRELDLTVIVVGSILKLLSNGIILIALLSTLVFIDGKAALSVASVFALAYYLVISANRVRLIKNSEKSAYYTRKNLKALQEGMGSMRDIVLSNAQELYLQRYMRTDGLMRNTAAESDFLSAYPRFTMECVGVCLIGTSGYFLVQSPGDINAALPILAVLALGAQRILPALQQMYGSWANIKAYKRPCDNILMALEMHIDNTSIKSDLAEKRLLEYIEFKNVSFKFSDNEDSCVLKNMSFRIEKGQRIGIIGETGSGKSTLVDILMGLLTPSNGEVFVDGVDIFNNQSNLLPAWRRTIAHVPQAIFLSDCSIAENIAFSQEPDSIDMGEVTMAASMAQIDSFIETLPSGYQTNVGERGIKLSGGQRQRIGIARALFSKSSMLILDEATSALDTKTEENLMHAISMLSKDITIVIIAHRLSTVMCCDRILRISNGALVDEGSPIHVIENNDLNSSGRCD